MDAYDSDSSGLDDDGAYTETGVLLGYASSDAVDDSASHLGGWPTWLDPSSPPPGSLAKCRVCADPMPLLLQLNADLPECFPGQERWLYVFACVRRTCVRKGGCVRALRAVRRFKLGKQKGQKREEVVEEKKEEKVDIGASLFGVAPGTSSTSTGNVNPFSTGSSSTTTTTTTTNTQMNPFAPLPQPSSLAAIPPQKPDVEVEETKKTLPESFADKLRVSSSSPPPPQSSTKQEQEQTPWPAQSAFPTPYTHHYLDADYETLSAPPTPSHSAVPVIEDEGAATSGGSGSENVKDTFESTIDKDFLRFSLRLGHNPEQVLRYEFRGVPLLYETGDAVGRMFVAPASSNASKVNAGRGIPRCEACGKDRVFEVQLVPHAISVLEEDSRDDDAGMEWGTVIVGVCAANCGLDEEGVVGWREEWVGVQWEERS